MEQFTKDSKVWSPLIENKSQPILPRIQEIATLVTCALCGGYLIDATTITGCLHSFCHACIIAHLQVRRTCPTCHTALDSAHPKFSLRRDKVLQRIIYKIIPGLYHWELERRVELAERLCSTGRAIWRRKRSDLDCRSVIYCDNDFFSIALHYGLDTGSTKLLPITTEVMQIIKHSEYPPCPTRLTTYLQCPARLTVRMVKKFVRLKYEVGPSFMVELFSGSGERIDDQYTLIDVAYVFTGRKVGSLQLHYLVVNRNAIARKWPSKTPMPCGVVEEIDSPPLKRKRGRPPKHQPRNVKQSNSSHQEITVSLIDSIRGKQTLPDVSGPSNFDASLDQRVSSDFDSRSNSLNSSAKVSYRLTDKPELNLAAGGALPVDNELSCEVKSFDSVQSATALSLEQRQLCSIVHSEQTDSGASHAAYQPMVLINPFVGSLFSGDGLVFPSDALEPSVQHSNLQLVGLLNVPCFISDIGMKTEGGFELTGDQAHIAYPDIYSCTLPQGRDLSKSSTEVRPWKSEFPSYWRVQHEMIEAQHYETFTADLPLLTAIESNPESDNYVSVLNSMTSVAISSEPGKLLAISKGTVEGDDAEVEMNSSVLLANSFMPATSAMTYVAESIEVSEAISECTDADDRSSSDVTTPHRVRHLSSMCSHKRLLVRH